MSEKRELFSLEAEQGVLGAVLKAAAQQDLELVEEIVDAVCVEDFYFDDNAALFDVIADLHREGIPVDPVTVAQLRPTLPSDQRTLAYAGDLAVNVPSTANWRTYATHVRERSVLRKVVAAAGAVHELAHESRPVPEIVAQAQQALADLRDLGDDEPEVYRIGEVLSLVVDRIDDDLNGRTVPHLSTGLVDLDHLLRGGLRRKSMVVIAGRPGEGKTTLGLQIAQSVVLSGSGVGLVFSLEMTKEELATRGIASVGGVDLRRLDDASQLQDDDWTKITAAVGKLKPAELYLCDRPGLTVARIRSIARQVQRRHGLDVLVVDYIGLIATSGRAGNRAEAIGAVSTALKNLSKELCIPVLVLAQLNRESTKRTGKSKRPQASDLRDSGQIEQDADAVLLVHRDKETEEGQNGVTELILDKGRQAPVGSCFVQQQGQFARFVSFATPRELSQEEVEMGRPRGNRYAERRAS